MSEIDKDKLHYIQGILEGISDIIEDNKEILPKTIKDFYRGNLAQELMAIKISLNIGISLQANNLGWRAWNGIGDNIHFGEMTEQSSISWPDDGRQATPGWYVIVSFPTGAYIFGEHYPKETFDEFFEGLKTFKPDHSDTVNKSLYFKVDTPNPQAGALCRNYKEIFNKYAVIGVEERNKQRIEALEKELRVLKNGD